MAQRNILAATVPARLSPSVPAKSRIQRPTRHRGGTEPRAVVPGPRSFVAPG